MRRGRFSWRFVWFVMLVLGGARAAVAAPDAAFEQPRLVAIENRAFNPKYDVTGQVSILPLDAFYKGFAVGASYTHGISSAWSWEVLNANFVSKQDTSLKNDLLQNFNVRPQGILDHIKVYATSHAVYTPIYSKNLIFNRDLLYGSFSFLAGGGMVSFSGGETTPMLGGGVILRVFHSPKMSSKFDGRLYSHFASKKSSDVIVMITYGLSFEFGSNQILDEQ